MAVWIIFIFQQVMADILTKNISISKGSNHFFLPETVWPGCPEISDWTTHLLACTLSSDVSSSLVNCLSSYFPTITHEDIVLLNMQTKESLEVPLAWLVSTCISFIWEQRVQGKQARLVTCRAELLANEKLLRDTKWRHYTLHNCALLLEDMLNLHLT